MGLIGILDRAAGSRAHVLVAEAPRAFRERVALERALDRMGWCRAESVADADVLAIVGDPGDAFSAVVEHVWAQMSEPRVRFHLRDEAEVAPLLGEARNQLSTGAGRRTGAEVRRGFTPSADAMAEPHDEEHDGGHDHRDHGGGHDSHGDGGGVGHDHGAMMPDGLPLAEGAEDRDGLEMDELHVPLGPVLTHWPAGLVLRATLHGDVVVDAEVERLPTSAPGSAHDDAVVRAAHLLDAASSVLALAGLPAQSARARVLRDRCLDHELDDGRDIAGLGARVARMRALRWIIGGLTIEGSHGGSETLHDRLTALFERARAELDGEAPTRGAPPVQALPTLVRGMELATLRLWLAALAPDLVGHEPAEAGDG